MFDGSHRAPRRTVDLGSKRHRNDKTALLEQARIRREERRVAAEKTAAAAVLQRVYRGYASRCQTAVGWENRIRREQQQQQELVVQPQLLVQSSSQEQQDRVTPVLNALFGLKCERKLHQKVVSLLDQYAAYIERRSVAIHQQQQQQPPRAHRIVQATLKLLAAGKPVLLLTAHQAVTILSYTLDLPVGGQVSNQTHSRPNSYYWNRAGGIALLVETYHALSGPTEENAQQQVLLLKSFLYECVQACLPDTVLGRALQGALTLSNDTTVSSVTLQHLPCMLQVLQRSATTEDDSSKATAENLLLSRTVRRLVSSNVVRSLQAIVQQDCATLDAASVAARMRFLKIVLLDTDNSARLVWMLNRVVTPAGDSATAKEEEMIADTEQDSDDEDEEEKRAHAKTVATQKTKITSYYRLSKHDLQTVPRLDRLFSSHVQKADKLFAANSQQDQLQLLAITIGDPTLWLQWGNILFSSAVDENVTKYDNDMAIVRQGREDYVTVLAILLQATTGLRPRQNASSSQLLNKLAFSPAFLSNLWKFVVKEMEKTKSAAESNGAVDSKHSPSTSNAILYFSFSLFSDLFAHNLIALRDDQFLSGHTTTRSFEDEPVILAEDVITHLRTLLYELYWTKPVRAVDLKLILGSGDDAAISGFAIAASSDEERFASARARLLLTGTKLWNSLYERWCRLVRHAPFCVEATWCFPKMTSLSSDNDVVASDTIPPVNRRGRVGRPVDDDEMDIDDSSSDSEMDELDHHVEDAESDQLADVFSDPKMARLLASIPQALPFDRRVKLFHSLLRADKIKTQDETADMHQAMLAMMRGRDGDLTGREMVQIRRDQLYDDSMRQLNQLGPKLKRRVQVSFINQHGAQEPGIDGGGVFKEFIDDLIKDAFSVGESTAGQQLFSVTPLQTLTVNSDLLHDQSLLSHYEFLGRVLGKAVYESILVEPQFCLPFLNQLLGKSNSMEDLKNFDLEYYRNLTKLLNLNSVELDSMGLAFELTVGSGATAIHVELTPGGRNVPVTKENVIQYIHLVSHQRLNVITSQQTRAFLQGFRDLIPASWVRLFSAYELQNVISGDDSVQGIDVASLKRAMQYAAGYHPDQPVIRWFWEIVEEMTVDQQHKFLKFMTSCSRQPLLGFGSLEPAPCVQQIRLPEAFLKLSDKEEIIKQTPLPTSATCMNLLKLPNYGWKELLRRKLLKAIESGAGFELT